MPEFFLLDGGYPLIFALAAVFLGAIMQASTGVGFGMVAAPVLMLADPRFVPGPILLLAILISGLSVIREWRSVDRRGLAIALSGRIPGTVLAGMTLSLVPGVTFGLIFGVLVLIAVILSMLARRELPTTKVLLSAGFVSGYMGTLTSIGAPPMAIAYQHGTPAQIRATMGAFFVIGAAFSIAMLALFDRFGTAEIVASVIFVPVVVLGYWASSYVVRKIDKTRIRQVMLAFSGSAAVILIVRSLLHH